MKPIKAELLARIRQAGLRKVAVPSGLCADIANRHEPFAMTEMQQAYWIGRQDEVSSGGAGMHIYLEYEVDDFDLARFESAWEGLLRRHDMLRVVAEEDGTQRVLETVPAYRIEVEELSGLDESERSVRRAASRTSMSHRKADIHLWPQFALRVLREERHATVAFSLDTWCLDGRSIQLLFAELNQRYLFPGSEFESLDVTFRDYVGWLEEQERSESFQASLSYWRERLATLPGPPELPLRAYRGGGGFVREDVTLDAAQSGALKSLAAARGLTINGMLLGLFAEVLGRWSANPRFTLNIPRFNRPQIHPQINDVVGEFATFTLLEVDGTMGATLGERLAEVQARLWRELDHGLVSGVRVLREISRASGSQEAMSMPIVFTSAPEGLRGEKEPDSWFGKPVYTISQTPQVWLDCQYYFMGDQLYVNWDYLEARFPAGLVARMFASYRELLQGLASGESASLLASQSPIALPAEQAAARQARNDRALPYDDRPVYRQFVACAREPGREAQTAVVAGDGRLSYGELLGRSTKLGARLSALLEERAGVVDAPAPLVGILLPKGLEQVVSVYGVLASGAACLPLDVEQPAERLREIVRDAEPAVILVDATTRGLLDAPGLSSVVLDLDDISRGDERAVPEDLPGWCSAGSTVLYVMYTSGSTGQPKGVVVEQRGVLNALHHSRPWFGEGRAVVALGVSALHHDMSVYDVLGVLTGGGRLVLPAQSERSDPGSWSRWVEAEGVNAWVTVPAALEMLLSWGESYGANVSSLETVLVGGDWVSPGLYGRLQGQSPGARLYSVGGPTETTMWNIVSEVVGEEPGWSGVPYGAPLPNCGYRIVDGLGRECPDWVTGEMYCRGVSLARGYLNDAARTAARFVRAEGSGEREYRTGDLGFYHPDGRIEFVGRSDGQLKVRGHRVESGEVESVLGRWPEVSRAVAYLYEGRLAAALVLKAGQMPMARSVLHERALAGLAAAMVPSEWLQLESLPLTRNGKVDLAALRVQTGQGAQAELGDDSSARVLTPQESGLADLWEVLLGRRPERANDNFFAFGGDSLLAVRLAAQVKERLAMRLGIGDILTRPMLGQMAEKLRSSDAASVQPAFPMAMDGPVPLSHAQRRLWLQAQLDPLGLTFLIPMRFVLRGVLDESRLELALHQLVLRHAVLDARIVADEQGDARLVFAGTAASVAPGAGLSLPREDLRALAPQARQARLEALAREQGGRPLDLGEEAPLRLALARVADEAYVLYLTAHHAMLDGVSCGVLLEELLQVYGGEALAPLQADYASYCRWEHGAEHEAERQQGVAYWRERLQDMAELVLPYAGPVAVDDASGLCSDVLPALVRDRLQALARSQGVTPFAVYAQALGIVLGRVRRGGEVVFGTYASNRVRTEFARTVGMFVNPLVLRLGHDESLTVDEALLRVHERIMSDFAWQQVPFEQVVEAVGPVREPGRHPLFEVGLVCNESLYAPRYEGGGLTLVPQGLDGQGGATHRTALEVWITPSELGLDLVVTYAQGRVGTALAEGVLGALKQVLVSLSEVKSGQRVCEIEWQPQAWLTRTDASAWQGDEAWQSGDMVMPSVVSGPQTARQTLTGADSNPPMAHLRQAAKPAYHDLGVAVQDAGLPTAAALLREHAEHDPEEPALWTVEGKLSWRELDRRSNGVARALIESGVAEGDRIGVSLAHSALLVVSALGVLKAGGTLVLVDASDPPSRQAWQLSDAGVKLLLATDGPRAMEPGWAVYTPVQGTRPVSSEPGVAIDLPVLDPSSVPESDAVPLRRLAALYVVYTSGSTGRPKGVQGHWRGFLNRLRWLQQVYPAVPGERGLLKTAVGFVDVYGELLGHLLSGIGLVVADDAQRRSPADLLALVRDAGVTRLTLTPSVLASLCDEHESGAAGAPGLRLLVSSGEPLDGALVRRARACFGGARILNVYGSSEVGADVAAYEVTGDELGAVPAGGLIPNVRARVLGGAGWPQLPGVAGELEIGGVAVADGYVGAADEITAASHADTASPVGTEYQADALADLNAGESHAVPDGHMKRQAFDPDAVPTRFVQGSDGSRWFRTGDEAWRDGEGRLRLQGRRDDQVKLRGMRLDLRGLDAALAECEGVKSGAVALVPTPVGDAVLGALVVLAQGTDLAAVRSSLSRRLPAGQVPGVWLPAASLPRLSGGKLDRRGVAALLSQALVAGQASASGERTLTVLEERVAQLWRELLRHEGPIGPEANFFALGGHSLMLARLASRLRVTFAIEVNMADLFSHATIASQAELIQGSQTDIVDIPKRSMPTGLEPLSANEARLWFLQRSRPDATSYNMTFALRLHGRLEVPRLAAALNALAARHDGLRTAFVEVRDADGLPQARRQVAPTVWFMPGYRRVMDDFEAALQDEVDLQRRTPFDLAQAPLLRAVVLQGGDEQYACVLALHHVIADGWSMGVFMGELGALYRGEALPEPDFSLSDYADWQGRWLADTVRRQRGDAFWRTYLDEAPAGLALPLDNPHLPHGAAACGVLLRQLDPVATEALRDWCRREAVDIYDAVLAAFAATLHAWTGQADIVVGTVMAGRHLHPALDGMVGFLANTVPIRLRSDQAGSLADLVADTVAARRKVLAFQHHPFERIVQVSGQARSAGQMPLVRALCIHQNVPHGAVDLPGVVVETVALPPDESKFDLNLQTMLVDGELSLNLEYAAALFHEASMQRFMDAYVTVLSGVARTPAAKWRELDLFARPKAHARSGEFDLPPDLPRNLPAMLRRTAHQHPHGRIVLLGRDGEHVVDYRELLAWAEEAAARMHGAGLRAGQPLILVAGAAASYLRMLWGAFLLGAIPVTVARATSYEDDGKAAKLLHTWETLDRPPVLAGDECHAELLALARRHAGMHVLALSAMAPAGAPVLADPAPADTAFFQLTAGSTGQSKCIDERHESLLAYMAMSSAARGYAANQRSLNWLPFDHIVPLLTCHLRDVFLGREQIHVETALILEDPALWPRLLSERRVTHSWAPNFAYRLAAAELARMPDGALQLGHVSELINAGEMVTQRTLADMAQAGARFGLAPATLVASFGMAECCTCITYAEMGEPEIGVARLQSESGALQAGASHFASLGRVIPGMEIRIAGSGGETLEEYQVGRMQIRGATVTRGYLNLPKANAEAFPGEQWFDSGDNGFMADGRLYLTGRSKEVLIVNGVNYFCHDLEERAQRVPGVEPNCVAALSWRDGEQEAVAICYVARAGADTDAVNAGIRATLIEETGLFPKRVIAVAPEHFAKTTSGKIQRTQMAQQLASGALQSVAAAGVARLAWQALDETGLVAVSGRQWHVLGDQSGLLRLHDGVAVDAVAQLADCDFSDDWQGLAFSESVYRDEAELVALVRALGAAGAWRKGCLRALVPVGEAQAAGWLYGLLQTLAQEYAGWLVQVIELDAGGDGGPGSWPQAAGWFRWQDARWQRQAEEVGGPPAPVPAGRPGWERILITGGAGALARTLAEAALARGADVTLLGRSAPPAWLAGSSSAGRMRWVRQALTDPAQVAAALRDAGLRRAPDAIYHLAGVFETEALLHLSPGGLQRAAQPKTTVLDVLEQVADVLWAGHRASLQWVLYGSVAAVRGAVFAGAYAAANGGLLGRARQMRVRGSRVAWLGWSAWQGRGMGDQAGAAELLRAGGLRALGVEDALALHERYAGLDGDFLLGLSAAVVAHDTRPGSLAREGTEAVVLGALRAVLRSDTVAADDNFFDAGGSSIALVQLQYLIRERLGIPVDITTLLQYPSARRLSQHLDNGRDGAGNGGMPGRAGRQRQHRRARSGVAATADSAGSTPIARSSGQYPFSGEQ